LAAGIAVGLLVIPLIASISEDALRAVPMALREAASGLGARKVTTTLRVVLPAAVSGLMAAIIVGFSRAIGETMVKPQRIWRNHHERDGRIGLWNRSSRGERLSLSEPLLLGSASVLNHLGS
ncbi:MAG: ABC transporter permease subunit, partial [Acidimicrobiales bacterium]